jgi:protein transport protein SEC24
MLVVTDLTDLFIPLPTSEILVNLNDSKEIILNLLDKLPSIFQTTQKVENALGVALKAAAEIAVFSCFISH